MPLATPLSRSPWHPNRSPTKPGSAARARRLEKIPTLTCTVIPRASDKKDVLADAVAGRDVRLLLVGLHSIAPVEKAQPPRKGAGSSSSSSRAGAVQTAERLLRCLRLVQAQLQKSRVQHQLLNLTAHVLERRADSSEHVAAPEIETSELMKDIAARASFWQVMRSDYWRKREHQPPEPHGESPPSPALSDRQGSVGVRSPELRRRTRMRDSSPQSPSTLPVQRRGFENLKGFRQSSSTGQLPQAVNTRGKLLSIDGAVKLLKDSGLWEELSGTPQAPRLSRASSAASLPAIVIKQSGDVRPGSAGDDASVASEKPLTPGRVFPHLVGRKPMAPRRLIFADTDSTGSNQKLAEVMEVARSSQSLEEDGNGSTSSRSRRESWQDFDGFSQYFEGSSHCSGSTRGGKMDPADLPFKHPPRWARSKSVNDKLDPSGIFRTMGPTPFPRVDADAQQFDDTPELAYLTAYEDSHLMPRVPRSVTTAIMEVKEQEAKAAERGGASSGPASPLNAPTHRLDIVNYGVGDAALKALSESLKHLGRLECLNLSGNKLKGGKVAEFFRTQMLPHGGSLKELDLSGNRDLGGAALDALTDLVRKGDLRVLQTLNLNSVNVPDHTWEPLLNELTEVASVRTLCAADTRFGFRSQSHFAALGRLLSKAFLTRLDLSGNFLRHEGCEKLGKALAESDHLVDLDLSHNAGDPLDVTPADKELKDAAIFTPLLHICEGLSRNTVLENLLLAHCSLGYAADFLLGEAIARHPNLRRVDVSSNPHGGQGLACLLRALGTPKSKLQLVDVSDARNGSAPPPAIPYSWAEPSGDYALNLVNPQHRGVLRALLNRGKASIDCFKDVKASGLEKGWGLPSCATLDYYGMPTVPLSGLLTFSYTAAPPGTPRGDANPLAKMQDWNKLGKIRLGSERTAAMLASYRTCRTDDQRSLFLDAVSGSFVLKNAHLESFRRLSAPTLDLRKIIRSLLHGITDGALLCSPTGVRLPNLSDGLTRLDAIQKLFMNPRSPTGRYSLGLANPSDRACAAHLQALCSFERKLRMAQGRPDVSQLGTQEPVRNLRLGHEWRTYSDLSLPIAGMLSLDYVSTAFPARGTAPAASPPELIAALCAAVRHSRAPWLESILAFRTVVDRLSLSADDVRALVEAADALPGQQGAKPARVEMLVACFGRCFERPKLASVAVMHNPDLFSKEDAGQLLTRLGRANVLDAENIDREDTNLPNGNQFNLDLAVHEDRQVALFLADVAKKESLEFLTECALGKGVWKADIIASEDFPPNDTFSCKYVVSDPELVSKAARKEAAQKTLDHMP